MSKVSEGLISIGYNGCAAEVAARSGYWRQHGVVIAFILL